jgi:predicted nucleotidyltransferase
MAQKRNVALSQQENQAIGAFVSQGQKNFPSQIIRFALFGSKARGDSGPDSDVDILVLVKEEDRDLRGKLIDLASDISLEYEVLLSPRVIGEERWRARKGFQLYQNIARDAVAI